MFQGWGAWQVWERWGALGGLGEVVPPKGRTGSWCMFQVDPEHCEHRVEGRMRASIGRRRCPVRFGALVAPSEHTGSFAI